MTVKLGINGFGRIGRLVLRQTLLDPSGPQVVAINDAKPCEYLAYLLTHDSAHGKFVSEITATENTLSINDHTIHVSHTRDPTQIKWKELGEPDIVLECTGKFLTAEKSQPHLDNGAKKVIFSAAAKDQTATFVYGVNHMDYKPELDVLSCASCTTNGLAPLAKIIEKEFGVQEAFMTTIHSATGSQKVVDGTSLKDWRRGRAAGSNIIPTTTGAAKALSKVIPELKGKVTATAFRVPTINVSVIDLTVRTIKETTLKTIVETVKGYAEGEMKGVMGVCDQPLVSSDFMSDSRSSILDVGASHEQGSQFFKLVAWYDNEYGYSRRLVDLAAHVGKISGFGGSEEMEENAGNQ